MKLPHMTTPGSITQGLIQFNHYVNEHAKKADKDGQLGERSKIIALMRIASKEFTDKLILDGVKIDHVSELELRLNAYKLAHRELDVIQGRTTAPMEMDFSPQSLRARSSSSGSSRHRS